MRGGRNKRYTPKILTEDGPTRTNTKKRTRGKWNITFKQMTPYQRYGRLGKPIRMLFIGKSGGGKTYQLAWYLNKLFRKFGRNSYYVILISESAKTDKTWEEWGGVRKHVDVLAENYDEELQNALPNMLKRNVKKGKRPIIIFDDKGYDRTQNSSSSANHIRYIATAANQNGCDLYMLYQRAQYLPGDMTTNIEKVMLFYMDPKADRELAVAKFLGRFEKKRGLAILDDNVREKHDFLLIDKTGEYTQFFNAKGIVILPDYQSSININQAVKKLNT